MDALDPERYEIVPITISKTGKWDPQPILPEPEGNPGIDVVFPVLHGTFGEDGTVQGLLELAGLPYVGPGVFASAASMDKEHFKRLCTESGLPVVEYMVAHDGVFNLEEVERDFPYPLFVKPCNLGSSVGVHKAKNREALLAAVADATRYDRKVIIERAIIGQELECAVLGNEKPVAATPCEILPSQEFYDYDDKYLLDQAQVELPARLPSEALSEVRRLAVECFQAMGCEGMSRVDFLVEGETGKIYINEINTIPGFTSISMYPKMWAHAGIPFAALVDRLIELALDRHKKRQALRYER